MDANSHDRIDLNVTIDASVEEAWSLVGEPGWLSTTGG